MEVKVRGQGSNGSRPAGCGSGLDPMYWNLCDTLSAWGVVIQATAALGFMSCVLLMFSLLLCLACLARLRRQTPGAAAALLLFLLGTAGIFGLPFLFIISLTEQTCVARVFLFGVLFSVVFGGLLARALSLLGAGLAQGWREVSVTLALVLVQVMVAVEWLLVVLVRDGRRCEFSQPEFAMLQIYVMVLLAAALTSALRFLCRARLTYSYSYSGQTHRQMKVQAGLLVLTLLLSVCLWVIWITLITYGNHVMGRSPVWDDPVINVALTANGWVLLLGHGFTQVLFMCRPEARAKEPPLDFTGWTNSRTEPTTSLDPQTARTNSSFQPDTDERAGNELQLKSAGEPEIGTDKDFTIPRPTTTNINQPYDDYYTHTHRV